MMTLLDLHGVTVTLEGDDAACEALAAHFAGFRCTQPERPARIRVRLARGHPMLPEGERWRADQMLERGIVYNRGRQTWVDHHGRALSHYDYACEQGVVTAPATDDLVELGYLMVHSRVGVHLERCGLVRAHGVGFSIHGQAGVVLMPSGGGKSRLAIALLRLPAVSLLSDDMVLLDTRGRAHPFPHPVGISDPRHAVGLGQARPFARRQHGMKWVIELEDLLHRHEDTPLPIGLVAVAERVSRPPSRIVRVARRALVDALWRDVVMGLGLPQVLELLARHGVRDLWKQAPAAILRARAAATMMRKAKAFRLEIADPESAAQALVRELSSP